MQRVLVPRYPGILCAMGLLLTDLRADFAATRAAAGDGGIRRRRRRRLRRPGDARRGLVRAGGASPPPTGASPARSTCATPGQNYELAVPLPDGPVTAATHRHAAPKASPTAHQQLLRLHRRGRAGAARHLPRRGDRPRAEGRAASRARCRPRCRPAPSSASATSGCRRPAASSPAPVYDRETLAPGNRFAGPAIVEQMDTTTVVLPGMTARVDAYLQPDPGGDGMNDAPATHAPALDPITVEVIGAALVLHRRGDGRGAGPRQPTRPTSRSGATARPRCSTPTGSTLCQAEHIPIHLGSFIGIVAAHPEARTRSPRCSRATSSSATTPMRAAARICPTSCWPSRSSSTARIVAWAVNLAHHSDFADRGHAHIFQEGLRIPPVRLYRAGELQKDVLDLILLNCQVPRERLSDLRAQMAANRLGVQRFQALCAKYGTRRGAGRRRRAAGLRRAQDARRHRRHPGRHLPLRGRLRQPRDRRRAAAVGRDHRRGRRDGAALRQPAAGARRHQHDL